MAKVYRASKVWGALMVLYFLTGCAEDPRNIADAYATTTKADQDVADRSQIRDQANRAFELEQLERQATQTERIRGMIVFTRFATFAASLAIISVGVGLSWAAVGTGRAWSRAAGLRANLIQLPESTRQYPLLVSYAGKGRYTLTNPNSGGVMLLDTRRGEDRQLIATSGAVQLAGVVTREARRSKDAAGLALYQPVIVGTEITQEAKHV